MFCHGNWGPPQENSLPCLLAGSPEAWPFHCFKSGCRRKEGLPQCLAPESPLHRSGIAPDGVRNVPSAGRGLCPGRGSDCRWLAVWLLLSQHLHVHTSIHTHKYTFIHKYNSHTYTHTSPYVYAHLYTQVYIYTSTHEYIHMYAQIQFSST